MRHEQLFSESEIVDVVRRAAELQEAGSSRGYVPGLTREELVRMAVEAGIEPVYVEAALAEREQARGRDWAGSPFQEIERLLPVEVAPEEFDLVTESIKLVPRTSTQSGTTAGVEAIGRTLQGQVASTWDNPHFAVTSRGGRTRLRVTPTNVNAAGLTSLWLIPGVLSLLLAAEQGWVAAALGSLCCVAGAWATLQWLRGKAHQAAAAVADALEAGIHRAAAETKARLARGQQPSGE